MLPDLRIVIIAVLSTFVLTVGVGFYASSRMMQESKKRTDVLATLEETPVNRIALSWPEPMRQSEPLALDFAVTARALRNPVRDVTNEPDPVEAQPVRTAATDLAAPAPDETPAPVTPAQAEATSPPAAAIEKPEPAPEPDIRVAVQYPPLAELPPELRAPPVPVALTEPAAAPPTDAPAITGSVEAPQEEPEAGDAAPAPEPANQAEPVVPVRSDPAAADVRDERVVEPVPLPRPAPKVRAKKAAPKKAAARKAAKRPARRAAAPRATNAASNFFNFLTLQR